MREIKHPELRKGEVFVTNSLMDASFNCIDINTGKADPRTGFEGCGWKTKRLGKTAYDVNGNIISPIYRPVFAKKKELIKAGIEFD